MLSLKVIGCKNRNLRGFSLGREFKRTIFPCSGQGCGIISGATKENVNEAQELFVLLLFGYPLVGLTS
jgi:hypothetical protein